MMVLAWLVFYVCCAIIASGVLWLACNLVLDAMAGDRNAQAIVMCLSALLVIGGFLWSVDTIWGLPE